jgi:hypothetical protein
MNKKVAVYVANEKNEMQLKHIPPKTCYDRTFEFLVQAIIYAFVAICSGVVGFFIGVMQ